MSQTISQSVPEPQPQAYYPTLQDIDSTYSDSLCSDPLPPVRMLSPHFSARSRSLIHDVGDAEQLADNELNHYEDELQLELQHQIANHQHHSHNPLPNLSSMKSLSLDPKMMPFRPKPMLTRTPTLKNKETKHLCEKLDTINIMINGMNQYIATHKSKQIKNDAFIITKLGEIQDEIEDSEVYIEEHIDDKFIAWNQERKMFAMSSERERTQLMKLRKEMEDAQQHIEQLEREKQQLISFRNQATETSVLSHLSSLSHICESEHELQSQQHHVRSDDIDDEKEGKNSNASSAADVHTAPVPVPAALDVKAMKEKWDLEYKHEAIKMKREVYKAHYQEMNAFILKITQPQFRLPRQVIEIVSQTQSKLIEYNTQFGSEMERQQREVMNQRLKLIGGDSNDVKKDNSLSDNEADDLNATYRREYMQHKRVIKERMNELRALNMKTLQLKLDIMDVLQLSEGNKSKRNKHKRKYGVFLERFIGCMSRIFFDAKAILSTVNNACTSTTDCEEDQGYMMSPAVHHVVNRIPLTLKIIQLTDILSSSASASASSALLCLDDLRSYVSNIENFRLLLVQNGLNEYEFIEKLAIQLIHCGMIDTKSDKKRRRKRRKKSKAFAREIKLISNLFLSIIARDIGLQLFEEDMNAFIDLFVLIVKYPPVLHQINITTRSKKKHKKNLKQILKERNENNQNNKTDATKQTDINDAIKTYYNLYSNRILIKNLKKFAKYMRHAPRTDTSDDNDSCSSCYDSSSSSSSSSGCSSSSCSSSDCSASSDSDYTADSADEYYYQYKREKEKRNQKEKENEKKEIKSLMNVFNQLFVKCID